MYDNIGQHGNNLDAVLSLVLCSARVILMYSCCTCSTFSNCENCFWQFFTQGTQTARGKGHFFEKLVICFECHAFTSLQRNGSASNTALWPESFCFMQALHLTLIFSAGKVKHIEMFAALRSAHWTFSGVPMAVCYMARRIRNRP